MGEMRTSLSSTTTSPSSAAVASRNGQGEMGGGDDSMPDYKFDAMNLADSIANAGQNDLLETMNVMADPHTEACKLEFYAVPMSWFRKVWPVLQPANVLNVDESWRENAGRIENSSILTFVEDHTTAAATEDGNDTGNVDDKASRSNDTNPPMPLDMDRNKRLLEEALRRRHRQTDKRQCKIKPGLVHSKDFVFVGKSTWTIMKEKFGYDGYEIRRTCIPLPVNNSINDDGVGDHGENKNNDDGSIAIELLPGEADVLMVTTSKTNGTDPSGGSSRFIPIPAAARFPYDLYVEGAINDGEEEDDENRFSAGNPRVIPSKSDELNGRTDKTSNNVVKDRAIVYQPKSTASCRGGDAMDVDSNAGAFRRYSGRKRLASGLGNLGNTCFMNSTLQCLARTDPIRRYFLSGEFKSDLNRDNPLGTRGQLAEEFASLLCEMWGEPSKKRNVLRYQSSYSSNYSSNSSAVYPREFKTCLGQHAEQFVGYDQHDSQEFATYLLDALHEDTNRITKKPYIEKPEQGEDETDEVAARKAWEVHLRREDSRVMEYVMGQVKSRLECCEEGCNRVSTTFDPFMFLSVPIPGSNERKVEFTFISLDPSKRQKTLSLTLAKSLSFNDLYSKLNEELKRIGMRDEPISHEDLVAIDYLSGKCWKFYKNSDSISQIGDHDHIAVYELLPLKACKNENQMDIADKGTNDRMRLDISIQEKLEKDWQSVMSSYLKNAVGSLRFFTPSRSTDEERKEFRKNLDGFLDDCFSSLSNDDIDSSGGVKRSRDEAADGLVDEKSLPTSKFLSKPSSKIDERIEDLSLKSDTFHNVKTEEDLLILRECAKKFSELIESNFQPISNTSPDPIIFEVRIGKKSSSSCFGNVPIILRLPGNTTVYGLRRELASRLFRSIKRASKPIASTMEDTSVTSKGLEGIDSHQESSSESFRLDILRRACLKVAKRFGSSTSMNTSDPVSQLGSLSSYSSDDSQLAHEDDPDEREAIAAVIGERGTVKIEWKNESLYDYLDESEYDADHDQDQDDFMGDQNLKDGEENDSITLQKCIRKYCQKEQLDETEMWYCSKCQKHVRAWKQFHLYKAPPILIIHLKRFSYTAQSYTHRRDKINSHVDFPLEGLDLTEFVPHCSDDEKPIYDCYAISNHFGGCGGGHYTAYILGDDGAWSYYDDSSIQENQDKAKVVSSAAYVLYYRRRDVPVGGQDEMIVDPRASSPMLVEDGNNDPVRSEDDLSSNGAQAGDLDDTMDTQSNGSSRTSADVSREPSVCPLFDDSDDGGVPAGVAIPNNVYTKDFPPQ